MSGERIQNRLKVAEPSTLLPFLNQCLKPMSRSAIKEILKGSRVRIGSQIITQHDHPLSPGDEVEILVRGLVAQVRSTFSGLGIVYEDSTIIVIDKPAGLLSVATEVQREHTAFALLGAQLDTRRGGRPYVVHRLDKDTSGLLVFARSPEIRDKLQGEWPGVTKTYLAVVEGTLPEPHGFIESYLAEGRDMQVRETPPLEGGKLARTEYTVLATNEGNSLVEVILHTGKKHQIRVHMKKIGCPVWGDPLYGEGKKSGRRLGLHAWKLTIPHPASGKPIDLISPLPGVLQQLFPNFGNHPAKAKNQNTDTKPNITQIKRT